jgi:hypothetical protein
MMQSINFYFEEYRPKPLSFDHRFATLVLAISVVMLVVLGTIKSSHLSQQKQAVVTKQADLVKLQQEVVKLQQQLAKDQPAESLDALIIQQQMSLASFRKILASMQQPDVLQPVGYSQILHQLGEQKMSDIWLTQIRINAQLLSLQGSSFKSEAIPEYVDLLKNASALKRQFDELKVERDQQDTQLVNFALLNGRLSNGQ